MKQAASSNAAVPDSGDGEWKWGGCGDDANYGYRFTSTFVDARHREKNFPRRSVELARMLSALHNNELGRLVSCLLTLYLRRLIYTFLFYLYLYFRQDYLLIIFLILFKARMAKN